MNDNSPQGTDEVPPGPSVIALSGIPTEHVEWLWPGRLPVGKVVVVEGEPEAGKTSLIIDVAARLTTGQPMPDLDPDSATYGALGDVAKLAKLANCRPRPVLFMSAEDGAGDTIKPRFLAAGGDPAMFLVQQEVDLFDRNDKAIGRGLPPLPSHARHLAQAVADYDVSLVIIDGLGSFVDRGMSLNDGPSVRQVLGPLAAIAAENACTFVIIRHFNKGASGSAMNRGGGSIDIAATARVVLQVTRHPDDDEERVLTVMKSNLTKKPTSLTYRIEPAEVEGITTLRVEWTGSTHLTADAIAAESFHKTTNPDNPTKAEEARRFILAALREGPLPAAELQEAATQSGHSQRTFERARSGLKNMGEITSERNTDGMTVWSLGE